MTNETTTCDRCGEDPHDRDVTGIRVPCPACGQPRAYDTIQRDDTGPSLWTQLKQVLFRRP